MTIIKTKVLAPKFLSDTVSSPCSIVFGGEGI